ncbi:MAG: DNA-deoxyinosine glycosylase [Ahniella sp.]|nr:DNA-deoxyinosine glycosylase [Ahniella sp.]
MRIEGFAPLARADARVLVLGSMPGQASLDAGRYYAHPRNTFWRIMGEIHGFAPDAPYATRVTMLLDAGVALWDVLHTCVRPGSLDSRIDAPEANDLAGFLGDHPAIRRIVFNGAAAEALFRRHVLPELDPAAQQILRLRLPSTSPAHASVALPAKTAAWAAAFRP